MSIYMRSYHYMRRYQRWTGTGVPNVTPILQVCSRRHSLKIDITNN